MKGKKMKTAKMIKEMEYQVFNSCDEIFSKPILNLILKAIPNATKADVLQIMEYFLLNVT